MPASKLSTMNLSRQRLSGEQSVGSAMVYGNITGGLSTIDVTISPVDLSRAVLVFSTRDIGGDLSDQAMVRGDIIDSTTVRFTRGNNSGGNIFIEGQVIEFSNVRRLQRSGVLVTTSGGMTAATIIPVNVNKSIVFASWSASISSSAISSTQVSYRFGGSDSIIFSYSSVFTGAISFQVVEFE